MSDQHAGSDIADQINRSYWDSEETVGSIGDRLGVSRSALYTAVRPRPSGSTCIDCGEETVFTNRTARSSGTATCLSCEENAPSRATASRGRPGGREQEDADELAGWDRWREDLRSVPPQRAAMIGGAAALGVVLGATVVQALRHAR